MLRSRLTVILAALWMAGCAAPGGHPPAGSDNPQAGAGCAQPARPAVATDPATAQPMRAQVWACTDRRTVVTYPQPDRLRVVDRGCLRELPPVVSASGVRHEDAALMFWTRGTDALLQRKPGPPIVCREVRALSIYEDARVRGITFRGQGQEPGWLVEVGPGDTVMLQEGADAPRQVFRRLASISDAPSGTTVYTGRTNGRSLSVKLTGQPCRDTQSGARYPGSIELQIDGVLRKGCGVPLTP